MFHEQWFPTESQGVLTDLVRLVRNVPGHLVEIGAWEGRSTVAMANAAFPRNILTCDTWKGSGHEISEQLAAERDIYSEWQTNVHEHTHGNAIPHRMGWREFVPTIDGQVALAFIDAEHTRVEVADNIRALLPKMAPGGIICGDDAHHGPVLEGVYSLLPSPTVYIQASLWLWQMPANKAARDMLLLANTHPELAPAPDVFKAAQVTIRDPWVDYVTNVSVPSHAVSFATAGYLQHLCDVIKPARCLDLGSGFSSYVLARNTPFAISVDTDMEWAAKTTQFLTDNEATAAVISLDEYERSNFGLFDLVFHDLANGQLREDTMGTAVEACRPGGVVVFDDMHHESHREAMERVTEGWEVFSLEAWTHDPIDRWAYLAIKPQGAPSPTLEQMYRERCATPSDIYLHLPRMVQLVQALNARHVIELGSRSGVSTVAWLYALEQTGGHLTSVDLDVAPQIGVWPHWRHIQANDLDVVDTLEPADIVFIDTSHAYQQTIDELRAYRKLVRPGGVIVCHDTELPRPEDSPESDGYFPVKRAIVEFIAETGFDWVNVPECWGLGIIKVV